MFYCLLLKLFIVYYLLITVYKAVITGNPVVKLMKQINFLRSDKEIIVCICVFIPLRTPTILNLNQMVPRFKAQLFEGWLVE